MTDWPARCGPLGELAPTIAGGGVSRHQRDLMGGQQLGKTGEITGPKILGRSVKVPQCLQCGQRPRLGIAQR